MMYLLHDAWHYGIAPWRLAGALARQSLANPLHPAHYWPGAPVADAALEMFERGTRSYAKPAFDLGVPERVIPVNPFCRLIAFGEETGRDRLLVVAPLSGHYATLLRGTVAALVERYDVFITDWVDASTVPASAGPFGLDAYIDTCLDLFARLGDRNDLNVMAVCQPTVPVLAAIARWEAEGRAFDPRSAVLIGGPIDTRISPTAVNRLATEKGIGWFERHCIDRVPPGHVGAGRAVYPGFRQLAGFMSMNLDRHVDAHRQMFDDLVSGDTAAAERHRRFYDEYLAVMDLPAEFYLETVRHVFIEHALPQGWMTHHGQPVDLGAIRQCALMAIEGEADDITGIGQTRAALDLTPNLPDARKAYHLQSGAGHYGIFSGSRYRETIVPKIAGFIAAHAPDLEIRLCA